MGNHILYGLAYLSPHTAFTANGEVVIWGTAVYYMEINYLYWVFCPQMYKYLYWMEYTLFLPPHRTKGTCAINCKTNEIDFPQPFLFHKIYFALARHDEHSPETVFQTTQNFPMVRELFKSAWHGCENCLAENTAKHFFQPSSSSRRTLLDISLHDIFLHSSFYFKTVLTSTTKIVSVPDEA